MSTRLLPPVLVIGVGNDLRGDDAAGCTAADRVASWGRHGVTVFRTRQLLPEHAAAFALAGSVVLIDAQAVGRDAPELKEVFEARSPSPVTHAASIEHLLALTRDLYGRVPRVWMLGLPAESFDYGAALSPRCTAAIDVALRVLANALAD